MALRISLRIYKFIVAFFVASFRAPQRLFANSFAHFNLLQILAPQFGT
jgi:hypothetical protein